MRSLYSTALVLFFLGSACGVGTFAQTPFVGPTAFYLLSTSSPGNTSGLPQPTRFLVGASALWLQKNNVHIRVSAGYRSEEGSFATPQSQAPNVAGNRLHVIDPATGEPMLTSTITASSVEVNAQLGFPLLPLDSSGSVLGLTIGGLMDYMVSASQTDDYSAFPNHQGPKTVTAQYSPHAGFGALLGAYLTIPLDVHQLAFDVSYVFRRPSTMLTTGTPATEQNIGWLIGSGLRVGVTMFFRL